MADSTDSNAKIPWRIEAGTIPDMNFTDYRDQLIYETPKIKKFFTDSRSEQFIIVAPKGFGKTLLLIAKKKQLEERDRARNEASHVSEEERSLHGASAGGEIVDRPTGMLPFLSQERIALLKSDYQHWKNLWKIAIMATSIKTSARNAKRDISVQLKDVHPLLFEFLTNDEDYPSAATIFVALVEADHRMQIAVIMGSSILARRFNSIRNQISLFIDNVDEYFKPILEDKSIENDDSVYLKNNEYYRNKSNEIWTIAQISLAGAAYEFHKTNSHVKIYCTIRREAFLRIDEFDDQYQQILGSTLEIEYSKEDFLEIFKKNVRLMDRDALFPVSADNETAQFFGPENVRIRHRFVDKDEDSFEYLMRHTFYRPRDMMVLGKSIADLPVRGRNREAIKEAVDRSTDVLVRSLRREMIHFFGVPDLDRLLKHVKSNALTLADLDQISTAYIDETKGGTSKLAEDEERNHPFCVLYRIGMLGTIQPEFQKEFSTRQKFVKPRVLNIKNGFGLPMTEGHYLVHPALDNIIVQLSGKRYLQNFHSNNIIGNELEWKNDIEAFFVVKGDVCGFSGIMNSEYYSSVSAKLHEWAKLACTEIAYFEISGGDSVIFIDRSPDRVVRCAAEFLNRASQYRERSLTLRFGGAAGPIAFQKSARRIEDRWDEIVYPLGLALRTSARIEPHAPKGRIVVEDQFMTLIDVNAGNIRATQLHEGDLKSLPYDPESNKFKIQKNPDDPPYITKLWQLEPTFE